MKNHYGLKFFGFRGFQITHKQTQEILLLFRPGVMIYCAPFTSWATHY